MTELSGTILMTLLFRYLTKNNTLILVQTLAVGIGLYLLTDLFERLDNFIEAQMPFPMIATYFMVKIPLVISQILPVIFLLSTVIQLCLMARNRELIALQTGGISLAVVMRSLILCGVFWGGVQLVFSEYLGVVGERESARIWQEEVRKRNLAATVLTNVWFSDGDWIVSLDTLAPDNEGSGFSGYLMTPDRLHVAEIVHAPSFTATPGIWTLHNPVSHNPSLFTQTPETIRIVHLKQDPANFRLIQSGIKPQQLPLWQLGGAISQLTASGSNVEALRTAWHGKIAYAASLLVMAFVATAIVAWRDTLYIAVAIALVCTFLYYAIYTLGMTMGQQGFINPILGAWSANLVAAVLALWRLLPLALSRGFRK